jgi:hypothetical protein
MLKKIGLPLMLMAGMLAFAAPRQAEAKIRFGISIGAPIYMPPAPPYPYGYSYPYPGFSSDYYAAPTYAYPYGYSAPYVEPYYGGFSFGFHGRRDHDRHERNERFEHGREHRR